MNYFSTLESEIKYSRKKSWIRAIGALECGVPFSVVPDQRFKSLIVPSMIWGPLSSNQPLRRMNGGTALRKVSLARTEKMGELLAPIAQLFSRHAGHKVKYGQWLIRA